MHITPLIIYITEFFILLTVLSTHWYSRKNSQITITNQCQPKTCVIVTHYGWSDIIESNFNKVLDEAEAINARVIAVTQFIHGRPDASYPHLKKIEEDHGHLKVIISENICDLKLKCSQKCFNLIHALQRVKKEEEIIIFLDNDASIASSALEIMSKSLAYSSALSATGSRFYTLKKLSFSGLIVAGWVNIHHLFQKGFGCSSHWGGFCAIKNSPQIISQFSEVLKTSISDDMSLNLLVKDAKRKILLVDESIATSLIGTFSLNKLIEFTNRQVIIGFRSKALPGAISGCLLLAMLSITSLIEAFYAPYSGLMMWIMISGAFTIASFSFPQALKKRASLIDFLWLLFLPISFILMGYNALYSLFVSEISWSGIKYKFNKNGNCLSAEKIIK